MRKSLCIAWRKFLGVPIGRSAVWITRTTTTYLSLKSEIVEHMEHNHRHGVTDAKTVQFVESSWRTKTTSRYFARRVLEAPS